MAQLQRLTAVPRFRPRPTGLVLRPHTEGLARSPKGEGFTLIEILIVITIISILLSIAIPSYRRSVLQARETVLRENLYVLRSTIEQFTLDKKQPPSSLQDLVDEGYLRTIPKDITGSPDTWQVEYSDLLLDPEQTAAGISDVRSGSSAISTEGTPYNSW